MRQPTGSYIGGPEVSQLVGQWKTILGQQYDITGADVQWGQQQWPHHHHHHRRWGQPTAATSRWWEQPTAATSRWWEQPTAATSAPAWNAWGGGSAWGGGWGRDHRLNPLTLGALALSGAEGAGPGPGPAMPPPPLPPPPAPHPAAAAAMMAAAAQAAGPAVTAPAAVPAEVPPGHPAHPDHHLPPEHPAHPAHPRHPHHHRYHATGGWAPPVWGYASPGGPGGKAWPYVIPPRNLLVDRPGPTGADRVILPMSSGVAILPNTSAQITSRPQNWAFRGERIIIKNAADWVIGDIKIGNVSQFSQSGDIPGEMFANNTIDGFVKFTTCQTAMDFVIVTTFVGASEAGAPFVCGVLGTAAVS